MHASKQVSVHLYLKIFYTAGILFIRLSSSQHCPQYKQYFQPNQAAKHKTNVTLVLQRGLAAWREAFPFISASSAPMWALRWGKGQTLALGPRLFHTALCANPQSVAQSGLGASGVIRTAQRSGGVMKPHAVRVKTFLHRKNTRVTYLNASPILRHGPPEASHTGGLCGTGAAHACNQSPLLLVHLKSRLGSLLLRLRPCSGLIILYQRVACERRLLPPRVLKTWFYSRRTVRRNTSVLSAVTEAMNWRPLGQFATGRVANEDVLLFPARGVMW